MAAAPGTPVGPVIGVLSGVGVGAAASAAADLLPEVPRGCEADADFLFGFGEGLPGSLANPCLSLVYGIVDFLVELVNLCLGLFGIETGLLSAVEKFLCLFSFCLFCEVVQRFSL